MKEKTVRVWRKSIQYFWSWEQLESKAKFCFELQQRSPPEMPVRGQIHLGTRVHIHKEICFFPRMLNRGRKEECQIYSAWKAQFQPWCQSMGWGINNVHAAWSKYLCHVNARFVKWTEIEPLQIKIIYSGHISCVQCHSVWKYARCTIFQFYFPMFPFSFSLSFSLFPVLEPLLCPSLLSFLTVNALRLLSAEISLIFPVPMSSN